MKKLLIGIFLLAAIIFYSCSSDDDTTPKPTGPQAGPTLTDYDGNFYNTVIIGTQTWMQRNLDVSHYRNGDEIPQVQDNNAWRNLTTGAWCYYENNTANGTVYGKLYNWYAVNDPRGLAPNGYHIPSEPEWKLLKDFLGGETAAAGKITAPTTWDTPQANANSTGFTALAAGSRRYNAGDFISLGTSAKFWSSTLSITALSEAEFCYLNSGSFVAGATSENPKAGMSVRCVKDDPSAIVSDITGNVYPTKAIGIQTWSQKNLITKYYNNGDPIPYVDDPNEWANLTTGAYCIYQHNGANGTAYGYLYNWYAVNDPRGIAPLGYHIPSETDWNTLFGYLGGTDIAGGKMKQTGTTYWDAPNTGASNQSSFDAVAGGWRGYDGPFAGLKTVANFWYSSDNGHSSNAFGCKLSNTEVSVNFVLANNPKLSGYSVRFVKD